MTQATLVLAGKVLLVTATDTGVGKTFGGCALARLLVEKGRRIAAVKPVETGCSEEPSPDEDGVLLAKATGQWAPQAALVRLRAPLAPPIAADLENRTLKLAPWVQKIRGLSAEYEVVIVEGAGGLLTPLTWEETARDLALKTEARALLVCPDRLGGLNQALLAMEVLRHSETPLAGVVLNAPQDSDQTTGKNAEALRRFSGFERIITLPRVREPEEAIGFLEPLTDWIVQ